MPGASTRAAVRVPKRLTAKFSGVYVVVERLRLDPFHSATRSVRVLAIAVRHARASVQASGTPGGGIHFRPSCPLFRKEARSGLLQVERHPPPIFAQGVTMGLEQSHRYSRRLSSRSPDWPPIQPCSRRPRLERRPSRRTPRRTRGTAPRWQPLRVGPTCPAGGGSPASPASADRRSATW